MTCRSVTKPVMWWVLTHLIKIVFKAVFSDYDNKFFDVNKFLHLNQVPDPDKGFKLTCQVSLIQCFAKWPHQSLLLVFIFPNKKKRPKTKTDPLGFPYALMILSYIMCSMSLIGETLRRLGRTWSDHWNQALFNNLSSLMSAKDSPNPIRSRNAKADSSNRLFLLGLMDTSTKAYGVLNIDLSKNRMLKMKLRKAKFKDGELNIC